MMANEGHQIIEKLENISVMVSLLATVACNLGSNKYREWVGCNISSNFSELLRYPFYRKGVKSEELEQCWPLRDWRLEICREPATIELLHLRGLRKTRKGEILAQFKFHYPSSNH